MKQQKNSEICPSQIPGAQTDIFSCFVLPHQHPKTQRYSIPNVPRIICTVILTLYPAVVWCLLQCQGGMSLPLEGRLVLLFLCLCCSPPYQPEAAPRWITLPYLIIYDSSSSIIHKGTAPVIQRSQYTTISHLSI